MIEEPWSPEMEPLCRLLLFATAVAEREPDSPLEGDVNGNIAAAFLTGDSGKAESGIFHFLQHKVLKVGGGDGGLCWSATWRRAGGILT